jgi:DNA-binding ferritin-like protein
MQFVGRNGSDVLLASENFSVIVNEETNAVINTGNLDALIASAVWDVEGEEPKEVSIEIATAAITDLDIKVFADSDRMYTIPKSVQVEAKRALEWHKEHHRGGTPVGMNTARTLAKGGQIGIKKVRHIAKYFPRHEVDKKGKGYKPAEDGYPSNGRIAWALWGGDSAKSWASAIVERENKAVTASMYDKVKAYDLDYFNDSSSIEFTIRVHGDGSGIDRLYANHTNGKLEVWDKGSWSDLGESYKSFSEIDSELDTAVDGVIFYHFPVDSEAALLASALLDASPFLSTNVESINIDEAELVASAMSEIDWGYIDSLTFADATAPEGDGKYTTEERSENVESQVRDATGKFAKMGSPAVINGNYVGKVMKAHADRGTLEIQADNGNTFEAPANTVDAQPETQGVAPGADNASTRRYGQPLDVSGILGEPRDSSNKSLAGLPNRLPPLTKDDMQSMLTDWGSWAADQRTAFAKTAQATPSVHVDTNAEDRKAPNAYNDPYLRKWLDTKYKGTGGKDAYPNRSWYNPVRKDDIEKKKSAKAVGSRDIPTSSGGTGGKHGWSSSWSKTMKDGVVTTTKSRTSYSITAAGDAQAQALTPETSDVPPIYMAIVAQDDPQAVMNLVALIPADSKSIQPTLFKRKDDKWIQDEALLTDLNSPTPPPVIVLDDDSLADVMSQMSKATQARSEERAVEQEQKMEIPAPIKASVDQVLSILWSETGELLAIAAAGGLDRNRGNAETLRRYWTHGEGAAKIRWGTKGDWARCVRHLSKYLGVRAKGYCQLRHKEALGIYTATHAKRDRAKNLSEIEELTFNTDVTNEDMAKPVEQICKEVDGDSDFDLTWEPEEAIIIILQDAEEDPALLAAGGADRNRGNAEKLRRYWTVGEGGAKIRWSTGGDWTRCVRYLSKYMGPRAKGYCALRHKEMTGLWTGDKAHRELYGRKGALSTYSDEFIRSSREIISLAELSAQANEIKSRVLTASGGFQAPLGDGGAFFIPVVLPENTESGDGRSFSSGSVTMRELPLPLMWQIKTAQGHDGSVVVGRIDRMERTADGVGNAYGVFDSGEYGREAERLVRGGFIKGVSADLDRFEASEEMASEDDGKIGTGKIKITKGRIMGVTLVPKPAFQECKIVLLDQIEDVQEDSMSSVGMKVVKPLTEEALVACAAVVASIPVTPPKDWFENPNLTGPTPLTVDDSGRVFGHIAAWHVDHIGLSFGTKPPRSRSGYSYFHTGVIRTEEGMDVPVGQLTLSGGHAPLEASAKSAAKHYDDTASAFADVHAGEDAYGIWVSGALRPTVTSYQVREIRASAPSGDWRPIQGALELVAVCQVNVPGFPIARARVASGEVMALVAAGANYLARLKDDPTLLGEYAEIAKSRFASLKNEINGVETMTAGGGCGCCPACTSMCDGSCCANCTMKMSGLNMNPDLNVKPLYIDGLQQLLADVIGFYHRVHGYHWNVTGEDFAQYHELFQEIYEDVYGSIDGIAENIRKLGDYPIISLEEYADMSSFSSNGLAGGTPRALAADLYLANQELIEELKVMFSMLEAANEQGVCNFLAERIDAHQKWSWQLSSSISGEELVIAEDTEEEPNFETVFSVLDLEGLVAAGPSDKVREKLAKSGEALPDGSYPIRNVSDLRKAVHAYGRSKPSDRAKVRRHISKRAKALGKPDMIPDEWKTASASGMELSIAVADLRTRISSTSLTAAADVMEADATMESTGDVDPKVQPSKEGFYEQRYTAKTQPRDAQGKFRLVLARLKQDLGTASLDSVAKKVKQVENLDNTGNYAAAAAGARDVIDIVNRMDTGALDSTALTNVRTGATALAETISNLPLPFADQSQKVRFSDLPPALANLMKDMITKVEDKVGQKDAGAATSELKSFMAGGDMYSQSEISSKMNTLLRLLT